MKTVREIAEDLSAAEVVALSKLVTAAQAKAASGNLPVGQHSVALDLRVEVDLNRGEDYVQAIVAKADPWTLLAAALSHLNGVTVKSIVREALTSDPALIKSLKAEAAEALAEVKTPTDTDCNGKVTVPRVKVARAA